MKVKKDTTSSGKPSPTAPLAHARPALLFQSTFSVSSEASRPGERALGPQLPDGRGPGRDAPGEPDTSLHGQPLGSHSLGAGWRGSCCVVHQQGDQQWQGELGEGWSPHLCSQHIGRTSFQGPSTDFRAQLPPGSSLSLRGLRGSTLRLGSRRRRAAPRFPLQARPSAQGVSSGPRPSGQHLLASLFRKVGGR